MRIASPSRPRARPSASKRTAQLELELVELRQRLWLERADFEAAQQVTVDVQRDLEESRERYVELYDQAPIGYAMLDRNGFIREANLTLAEMLGVPRNRLVDSLLARYVIPGDQRLVLNHLSRCRKSASGDTTVTEIHARRPDGGQMVLSLNTRIQSLPLAHVRLHTSVLDVSARRQAEEALQALNQRLEERVAERTRDLRSLTNEILQVEERERFILANDIHDGLTQLLVAAGLKMGNIARAKALRHCRKDLPEARRLLDEALQAARTLTFNLSPPVLRELGLVAAARWLSQDIHRRFGVRVAVEGKSVKNLPDSLRLLVFRCLRELLINVGKHAGAKHARVTLGLQRGGVCLEVADDGHGFTPASTPGSLAGQARREGFGLFSMRERVAHLGGTMEVQTAQGKGTQVKLCVPVAVNKKKGIES